MEHIIQNVWLYPALSMVACRSVIHWTVKWIGLCGPGSSSYRIWPFLSNLRQIFWTDFQIWLISPQLTRVIKFTSFEWLGGLVTVIDAVGWTNMMASNDDRFHLYFFFLIYIWVNCVLFNLVCRKPVIISAVIFSWTWSYIWAWGCESCHWL